MNEPLNDEVLDGLPVPIEESSATGAIAPVPAPRTLLGPFHLPAQTAAAAAGGAVAGAALLGFVQRRKSRRLALANARTPRRLLRSSKGLKAVERKNAKAVGELVEIVASRSMLVDVHFLGSPGKGR